MPRRRKPPQSPAEEAQGRIVERPDGFYWLSKEGRERGPFETRAEAEADRLSGGESEAEVDATGGGLQEAESELGISEWIDPDTGVPAEDNVPRLEDH